MQMVEWHEMGCFLSNPLIRRVEPAKEETNTLDFDASFEQDDAAAAPVSTNPWIEAFTIDYFE